MFIIGFKVMFCLIAELSSLNPRDNWSVVIGVNVHVDKIRVLLQNLPALPGRRLFLRLNYYIGDGNIQLEEKEERVVSRVCYPYPIISWSNQRVSALHPY